MATYIFTLDTGRVGSEVKEEIEIETEGMTPEEEDSLVDQEYLEWIGNINYGGWWRKEESE